MGFSIKLAPGIRIRASSRGIRTSIGPRIARVHVGGGRTGFSTGMGPVGFYTSLGGGSRGRGARRAPSAAAYQRQLAAQQRQRAQAERVELARQLAHAFVNILNLHRVEFPPARPPVAPQPPWPDRSAIYQQYEKHALTGIGVFQRGARAQAKQRAHAWAENEFNRLCAVAQAQQLQWQQYLNERWQALCHNDAGVVIETLEEAFEDNEAPAAAVGVDGDEVSLVLLVAPAEHVVPEQMPTTTQAGNLSLKKLPQRDRADYYKQYVSGQILVTVREALAVAPGIDVVRVVVLRNEGVDVYGKPKVSCLLAARFDRRALAGVRWEAADAVQIVNEVSTERLFHQAGRSKELSPLDLADESGLRTLIAAVDLQELAASTPR